ncbi:hypothetical protein GCM10027168_17180 [Streptomyces capparidis]
MRNDSGSALPDESVFVVPEHWREHLHPRRGGAPGLEPEPVPALVEAARQRLAEIREELEEAVGNPDSDREMAEAARAHLDGKPDPLGAAVAATLSSAKEEWWRGSMVSRGFADLWAVEHGLVFAAEAAVAMGGIYVHGYYYGEEKDPRRLRPWRERDYNSGITQGGEAVARRVRSMLAAAGDAEYEAAVEALARLRRTELARVIVSYLVPTRTDWVDEILATPMSEERARYSDLLPCVLSGVQHVALLREHQERAWWGIRDDAYTVAEAVGPALAPVLADLIDQGIIRGGAEYHQIIDALAAFPTDEALGLLLARLDQRGFHTGAITAMGRFPARALRLLAQAATGTSRRAGFARRLLRDHVLARPELAGELAPGLPGEARRRVEAAPEDTTWAPVAPADALPGLLVEPPWTRRRQAAKPVVVKGLTAPEERAVVWLPGEREKWLDKRGARWNDGRRDWREMAERLKREGSLPHHGDEELACDGPEELVRPLLPLMTIEGWWTGVPERVAARFELDAVPALLPLAKANPAGDGGRVVLPFFTPEIATMMADWFSRLKKAKEVAREWFLRHPAHAARALVPAALGKAGRQRNAADAALRMLVLAGHVEEVAAAARFHGEAAVAGLEEVLNADPLERLPKKVPTNMLDLVDSHLLPQILLRERRLALPESAVRHVVTVLAMCKPEGGYEGVDVVKEACDPASLDAFVWALFQQIGKDADWVFAAMGSVGGDETARGLAPLIRAWPGENAHPRAVLGLDTLVAIGTDAALVQLNGIAQKVKFKGIKSAAQTRIADLADRMGLTTEQLADRLVPDFGLDRDGRLVLDYGPRSFTAGFDEQLKPYVTDGGGKRLKNLPKPGAKDDPELAPAAHARFAALKKDVRTVAADQIRRFEQAMVWQRRWSPEEFRTFIVEHPLLWHVARRLVWSTGDGVGFRIAEDRTLADADDGTLVLPEGTHVSVAHPVLLGDAVETWTEVFADYEILQPFPQLGRPVLRLADDERDATELVRFHGVTVHVGKLLGLEKHGWERGAPQDAGCQDWITRSVPGGRAVVLSLSPGIAIGLPTALPDQTIEHVWITDRDGDRHPHGSLRFGGLDPVSVSEVLADLTGLTEQSA